MFRRNNPELYTLSEQNLVKRDELVGKVVVNMKAEKLGEVKGVAYDANGRKELIVSSAEGIDKIYPIDQAIAIKDVILLEESKTTPTTPKIDTQPNRQPPPSHAPALPNPPPPIPRFPTTPSQTSAVAMKTCQFCKRENRPQSKFCVQCGKPL